ncbi:MAG: amino acid ABC transporter substrate-binding protein [Chlorobiaceae bacterium]|nr:amino acid ABC transporter substrate-binding protein [Chlorobiaceae bacterium]NTV61692.1 amino acid ABC transporter substrate-binding protein [Chlorobiaceae bacterium]
MEVCRSRLLATLILLFLVVATGCSKREHFDRLEQLEGKEFAILAGSVCDKLVLEKFRHAEFRYFNTVADEVLALQTGKVDAIALDEPILRVIAARAPDLFLFPELISEDRYGYAVNPGDQELKSAIDQTVRELRESRRYDEMIHRWFSRSGGKTLMPDNGSDGRNGVLKLGTAPVTEPFSYVDGSGNVVGFDIEVAKHVARKLGRKLDVVSMDFGSLIPALVSNKVDMIGACIIITEERGRKVLFSEPYYTGGIGVMVRKR